MRSSGRASGCDSGVSKLSRPRSIRPAMHTAVTALDRLASGTGAPTTERPMATSRTGRPAWRTTSPPELSPYLAIQARQARSMPSTVWARTGASGPARGPARQAAARSTRPARRSDTMLSPPDRALPPVRDLQALLAQATPSRDTEAREPVDGAGENIGFHVHADPGRVGECCLGDAEKVEQRDDQHQGRVLEQGDELVGHRGQRDPERLRQHDHGMAAPGTQAPRLRPPA